MALSLEASNKVQECRAKGIHRLLQMSSLENVPCIGCFWSQTTFVQWSVSLACPASLDFGSFDARGLQDSLCRSCRSASISARVVGIQSNDHLELALVDDRVAKQW